nr:hypothetical protein [Conexibacter sp. W3-3-2]
MAQDDRALAEVEVRDRVERVGVRRDDGAGGGVGEDRDVGERVDGGVAALVGATDARHLAADAQELQQREAVLVGGLSDGERGDRVGRTFAVGLPRRSGGGGPEQNGDRGERRTDSPCHAPRR